MRFQASTRCFSRSRIFLRSITAALLLWGCASSSQQNRVANLIAAHALTADAPDPPPSLLGIAPGTTTEQQLLDIFRQQGIADQCTDGASSVSCAGLLFISIDRESHIVAAVGYRPSAPLSLGQVIENYGDPAVVGVQQDGIPEVVRSVALLYFDNIHTRLTLPTTKGQSYSIVRSTPIENVTYLSDAVYQNMTDVHVVPWNGYGDYPQTLR
jgi:hypothetical protein